MFWAARKPCFSLCNDPVKACSGVIVERRTRERWATDLCRVWAGRDGWSTLALVIDCHTSELPGWHPSRSGKSKTAEAALEQALIARFGTLGHVPEPFLLRSDNRLVFTSRDDTRLVHSHGLNQGFITPRGPEQNRLVERVSRTLKGSVYTGNASRRCSTRAGRSPTGSASTTPSAHIRHRP